jgi:hypothetical protein
MMKSMLNKNDIKIKHILGSFRESPDYPTLEDFLFLMQNWYWNEGGHQQIHGYFKIEENGNIIFSDKALKEKLNNDSEVYENLIKQLLEDGKIKVNKNTKFTTYYEII